MLGYQHELNATNQGMSYEKNVFGPAVSLTPVLCSMYPSAKADSSPALM